MLTIGLGSKLVNTSVFVVFTLLSEPGFSGLSDFQDLPHQGLLMRVCVLFWNRI